MSIALTDDHRELGSVARSFLTAQKARLAARELLDSDTEGRPPFWSDLAELGWLGLHVDEKYGGSGFGLPELVVVIDELGRAAAPGPFVPTVVVSSVIAAVGTEEQKARLLPGLVDGTQTAAIGFGGNLTVSGGRISGQAGVVLGAGLADVLLLASGEDMLVVERTAAGVAIEVPENLDRSRRSGRVALTDVAVGDNTLPGARNAALARTRTLYAAEAVGGASD
jgi:alkylation response protein AidB-like acyl-CoA dehydrogenase